MADNFACDSSPVKTAHCFAQHAGGVDVLHGSGICLIVRGHCFACDARCRINATGNAVSVVTLTGSTDADRVAVDVPGGADLMEDSIGVGVSTCGGRQSFCGW